MKFNAKVTRFDLIRCDAVKLAMLKPFIKDSLVGPDFVYRLELDVPAKYSVPRDLPALISGRCE